MSGGLPHHGLGITFSNGTSCSPFGGGTLTPTSSQGYAVSIAHGHMYGTVVPPTAEEIAAALAKVQAQQAFLAVPSGLVPNFLRADPKQPDTLGWREWTWDKSNGCLRSPSQGTLWPTERHKAETWSKDDAVRGVAGIHALLVPRHWKIIGEFDVFPLNGHYAFGGKITGIVERFGKYVLGTEGWRAEQVVIKELLAPTTEIGLKLEQKYPNVIVHYPDQSEEGDMPCTSETSSRSEKGSRPLLPSPSGSSLLSNLLGGPPSQPSPISSPTPSPSLPNTLPIARRSRPNLALLDTPRLAQLRLLWVGVLLAWAALLAVRLFSG